MTNSNKNNPLDTLLKIGSGFDWITPTVAFIQDYANGPVGDFGIPANAGWHAKEIKRVLKPKGVKVWGFMYDPDMTILMFTVKKSQARWTNYLLEQAAAPVLYAPAAAFGGSKSKRKEDSLLNLLPRSWQKWIEEEISTKVGTTSTGSYLKFRPYPGNREDFEP